MKTVFLIIAALSVTLANPLSGSSSSDEDFAPYLVSITDIMMYTAHVASGSILNKNFVLTNARPLAQPFASQFSVVANIQRTWDRSTDYYRVDEAFVHPNFRLDTGDNDIGLLRTEIPIVFHDRVQPIAISSIILTNQGGILFGFDLDIGMLAPRYAGNHNSISNDECRQILGPQNGELVFDTKACIVPTTDRVVCANDNGSPFVIDGQLVAISSWNVPCAHNSPIVVERVALYLDFINSNIN